MYCVYSNLWMVAFQELPNTGSHINALDRDILLLKATSKSTLMCLEQCLHILQSQQQNQQQQHHQVTLHILT